MQQRSQMPTAPAAARGPAAARPAAPHSAVSSRPARCHGRSGASHAVAAAGVSSDLYGGIHHVGVLCADLPAALRFYCDVLGMEVNPARPDDRLPYAGAWLWVGQEMIHLMQLPNPDPAEGRPEHGGRDRHVCLSVRSIEPVEAALQQHGIPYTRSKSGRAALFFRDPDMNVLELAEQ